MAAKGSNQKTRKSNPMLTKTGKPRLGPLNIAQLTKLLDGARKKHISKIKKAIAKRLQTQTSGKTLNNVKI
jgi:hypothetical protein